MLKLSIYFTTEKVEITKTFIRNNQCANRPAQIFNERLKNRNYVLELVTKFRKTNKKRYIWQRTK